MAASLRRLVEAGMPPLLAKEVVARMAAGTDTSAGRTKLVELGMIPRVAKEVSMQAAGTKNAKRFTELGVAPRLAAEIVR